MPPSSAGRAARWAALRPKLVTCLAEGYDRRSLRADALAGLTVAIVALPLSMALAIASGATPREGLITAIVAGFLISALGGSRVQVGGPTGAFVVVILQTIQAHGYDGLLLATLMAGVLIVIAGLLRLGDFMRYMPQPVIVGFTAGIAVVIFTTQIAPFLGVSLAHTPGSWLETLTLLAEALGNVSVVTTLVGGAALGVILVLRRHRPRWPRLLISITVAAAVAWLLDLAGASVETIATAYPGLAPDIPAPRLPPLSLEKMAAVAGDALTIAFLAALEALLSATVADSMTGRRHRPNAELVAQGVANMAASIFAGLPATGALARTATNVRAGAKTPIAGMIHALLVLLFMMVLWPLVGLIPLASLAAVLFVVAYTMAEVKRVRHLLVSGSNPDRILLTVTFGLTVLVDLTLAIEVGVVLASLFFMHRMAATVSLQVQDWSQPVPGPVASDEDRESLPETAEMHDNLPTGVELFEIRGPLFFGVATALSPALERVTVWPPVLLVDLAEVPFVDASGLDALEQGMDMAAAKGSRVILICPREAVARAVSRSAAAHGRPTPEVVADLDQALAVIEGS